MEKARHVRAFSICEACPSSACRAPLLTALRASGAARTHLAIERLLQRAGRAPAAHHLDSLLARSLAEALPWAIPWFLAAFFLGSLVTFAVLKLPFWQAVSWWSFHRPIWTVLASWERPRLVRIERLDLNHAAVAAAGKSLNRPL